jgi:hypothetical protein
VAATSARGQRGARKQGPPLEALTALSSVEDEIQLGLEQWCRSSAERVLASLWETEVARLCGQRWRPKAGIKVARAGACLSDVTLAGRRVRVRRPRVRSRDGREIELSTFRFLRARDVLDRDAIAAITSSVCLGSTPASGDAITRRFLDSVAADLRAALTEPSPGFHTCLILGHVAFREHGVLVALGLTASGTIRLLALQPGSSDNGPALATLLRDVARRTAHDAPELLIVGEDPPLEAAGRRHFGASVPIYRCPIEKRRRVVGLLPATLQAVALQELRAAYQIGAEARARRTLQTLARGWARQYPGAAETLRDGLAETLTLHRLGAASKRRRRASVEPMRPRARP